MPASDLAGKIPTLAPFLVDEDGGVAVDLRAGIRGTARRVGTAHRPPKGLVAALEKLDEVRGDTPITRLDLYDARVSDAAVRAIAATGWIGETRVIDLTGARVGEKGLAALVASAASLEALTLDCVDLGSAAGALGGAARLARLSLAHCGLGDAGLEALGGAELPALEALRLRGADFHATLAGLRRIFEDGAHPEPKPITRTGTAAIAELASRLAELDLAMLRIDAAAAEALASRGLAALRSLDLEDVSLAAPILRPLFEAATGLRDLSAAREIYSGAEAGAAAIEAMAAAPFVAGLERLDLARNRLPTGPTAALLAAATGLRDLDLSGCGLGPEIANAFRGEHRALRSLRLMGNGLPDASSAAIARSLAAAPELELLGLSGNTAGAETAAALARLRPAKLGLNQTGLSTAELEVLLASPVFERATLVGLAGNELGDDAALALIASPPGDARVDLANNRISKPAFDRLVRALGDRFDGARKQRPQPPAISAEGYRMVSAEGANPTPGKVYPPKGVKKLDLAAHSCNGSRKWFVGYEAAEGGHRLAFVSSRGKRVDPSPAILVPPMKYETGLVFAIDEDRKVVATVCVGVGLFFVDLDSGEATRVADIDGALAAADFAGGELLFTRTGDGVTRVEVWSQSGSTWSKAQTLEVARTGYNMLAVAGDRMALGNTGFPSETPPVVFFERGPEGWALVGEVSCAKHPVIGPGEPGEGGPFVYTDRRWKLERATGSS